jgi:RNA recognition motif-containing protein
MNIYVGNVSFNLTEDELRQVFEAYGQVSSVKIIKDKITGNSRGFAFVDMPDKAEAAAAIAGTNGKEVGGRALRVNEAREREEGMGGGNGGGERRSSGGGSRGGYQGGGRSGGNRW